MVKFNISIKRILITGGTGTFGHGITEILLDYPIQPLEPKLSKQHKIINSHNYHAGRYFSKFF